MSNYVNERAERVLDLLEEEDGKVVREYIALKQAEAQQSLRYRYEGPPWGAWLMLALVVGPLLGASSYAGVGCLRDRRVQLAQEYQEDLGACRAEVERKEEAIRALGQACGAVQP